MKYTYTKEKRDPQIQWYNTESGKRWRVKFSVVKKGKRHYAQQNGLKSFADAQLAKAQLLTDIENKTFSNSKNITVDAYWERFSESKLKSNEWRSTTYANQVNAYKKHISPHFGKTKVVDVVRSDVQDWVIKQAEEHHTSIATSASHISILKAMMSSAVYDGIIANNPIFRIKAKGHEVRDQSMSRSDYYKLRDYIFTTDELSDRNRAIAVLALHGLRRGEIAGMKLKYVSQTHIRVAGQLNRFGEYTIPKSSAGIRDVPLMPGAYEILSKGIAQSRKKLAHMRSRILTPEDFIFLNSSANQLNIVRINLIFKIISEESGVKVWPHKLRHAFSTFAFSTPGVNPKDIAHILGHENIDMSMYYNTGTDDGKVQAMQGFANQFNQ
ncbi:tyrosine-type recombinase/integrase [Weissella tructae]|uniref:tyrosine-type recombinase/integrase n=1 Tax=Weissella tructae TaxID=887702 RepID=UPI003D92BAFE